MPPPPAGSRKPRGAGRRLDGSPRRARGTNPPASPQAAAYGALVVTARKAKGWTQGRLAQECGMSQGAIANIERGVAGAGPGARMALAQAFEDPTFNPKSPTAEPDE